MYYDNAFRRQTKEDKTKEDKQAIQLYGMEAITLVLVFVTLTLMGVNI